MKKILLFSLVLLFPIIKVNALYCSYSDLAYLKKLASNISYYYDYEEINNNVSFKITLTNLQDELYIVDSTSGKRYDYSDKEITIDGYQSGQIIRYYVYSTKGDCEDVLYTVVVNLPTYNPYYRDEICKGIENYTLCQKWSTHGLSYEKFKERVQSYLEVEKPTEVIEEEPEEEYNFLDILIDILLDYYYIPLIIVVIGSSIGIYVINKKSDVYY